MSNFENRQPKKSSLTEALLTDNPSPKKPSLTEALLTDNPSALMQYMVLESRMLQLEQARGAHRTSDIQMGGVNVEKVGRLSANSGYIIMTVEEGKNSMQTTNILVIRDGDNLLSFTFPKLTVPQAKEFNHIVGTKKPVGFKELKFLTSIPAKESIPIILAGMGGVLDMRDEDLKKSTQRQMDMLKNNVSSK